MFPFEEGDKFWSEIYSNLQQELLVQDDPILEQPNLPPVHQGNISLPEGRMLATPSTSNEANLGCDQNNKVTRKEIERQRRQQMSSLHASLRSLLPLESIKGKRSMSDHMNEAVKYIEQLKNNIQELSEKRNKLKRSTDSSSSNLEQGYNESPSSKDCSLSNVSVRAYLGGVEIVASSSGTGEDGFLLSRVFEALLEEGFDVVSCVSTRKDERFYNTIQCQAREATCIDVVGLQRKLNDVILSSE